MRYIILAAALLLAGCGATAPECPSRAWAYSLGSFGEVTVLKVEAAQVCTYDVTEMGLQEARDRVDEFRCRCEREGP